MTMSRKRNCEGLGNRASMEQRIAGDTGTTGNIIYDDRPRWLAQVSRAESSRVIIVYFLMNISWQIFQSKPLPSAIYQTCPVQVSIL